MNESILNNNKYTYEYNYIPRSYVRNNSNYNNNYEYNLNNIENESLRNEYDENYSNNHSYILMNEISKLKNKFNLAKEKLELAKNQKQKDDKYIENLEKQLILKYQKKKNFDNFKNKYNPNISKNKLNYNNICLNNQKLNNNKSFISDFSAYDNKKNSKKDNKNLDVNNIKNLNKVHIKNNYPLKETDPKIIMKRNNSTVFTRSSFNDEETNRNKKKINENINNNINDDYYSMNQNNFIDKNKLIIRNCNCIISLSSENSENNQVIKNLFWNFNKEYNQKIDLKNNKNEEKKVVQERYLIIDESKKPIYIKGKQILGMNLMPLLGENNEIISDIENNILFYDLEGGLHNQQELDNIILDNGISLVNENNMPLLGLNNIPIIDKYGDFLYNKKPLIDEDNNFIKGKYVDLLRDRQGKPIKILIKNNKPNNEGKNENQNKNIKNTTNNKVQNNKNNNNNPVVEIEIKPSTKLITSKNKNYYYYLKKYQKNNKTNKNNKSTLKGNNKFSFENSLRNYMPK